MQGVMQATVQPKTKNNSSEIQSQYDAIATAYRKCYNEELWKHTTIYTFQNCFFPNGLLDNATVLDLGCGTGLYTRWAVSQGASRVVGVDISEQQITCARQLEQSNPTQGKCLIEYIVQDALDIDSTNFGQFDVVLAVNLLQYSQNIQELRKIVQNVALCLKKGGWFIGVRECMTKGHDGKLLQLPTVRGELENGPAFAYELLSCGSNTETHQLQFMDFCPCRLTFRNSDGLIFSFTNHVVYESTMLRVFAEQGFKINTTGRLLSCSPEGKKQFPSEFIKKLTGDYGALMWYFDVNLP